jgi:hypothetical protein
MPPPPRLGLCGPCAAFALLLFTGCAQRESTTEAATLPPEARAARAGELREVKGLRVLRLFGPSLRERGFAHGFFLAPVFIESLDEALCTLPGLTPRVYEEQLLPWSKQHFADAGQDEELQGLYAGLLARLGREKLRSAQLGREVTLQDLGALNVLADFYGPGCSSFAAWGERTAGGAVVHGRNLDFPLAGKAIANQVLFVAAPLPEFKRKGWAAVGWPGLTGCYSGINEDGLVVCLHDALNARRRTGTEQLTPRAKLLRRLLEELDPAAGDAAEAAARKVGEVRVAGGNLFHLSWPRAAAEQTRTRPSAVLEFDGASTPGRDGVRVVRPDDSQALVLTNYFRLPAVSPDCPRFARIAKGLETLREEGAKISYPEARRILLGGEMPLAAHTVVFFPDTLTFHVALTRGNVLSPRVAGVEFRLRGLMVGDNAGR